MYLKVANINSATMLVASRYCTFNVDLEVTSTSSATMLVASSYCTFNVHLEVTSTSNAQCNHFRGRAATFDMDFELTNISSATMLPSVVMVAYSVGPSRIAQGCGTSTGICARTVSSVLVAVPL